VTFFPEETYSEVPNALTEEVQLDLRPIPAVVKGRLWATDELANRDTTPGNPEPNRIFYQKPHDGITFKEHELINLLTNPVNQVEVDTDEAGNYTALIIPGIYGVQIPTMTDYTGHNVEFGDLTAGSAPFTGPWPYPSIWPYQTVEFGHHGAGLAFQSSHEYQLDLFVHAHYINACGNVSTSGEPFGGLVLRMNQDGTGVVSIGYNYLSDVGAEITLSGPINTTVPINDNGGFLVPAVDREGDRWCCRVRIDERGPHVPAGQQLFRNAERFRTQMTDAGFRLLPGEHPIIPVMLEDAKLSQDMANAMFANGVYVTGFFYPVVPKGLARIRTQMNAALTRDDLDAALRAFERAGRRTGVL